MIRKSKVRIATHICKNKYLRCGSENLKYDNDFLIFIKQKHKISLS